MNSIFVQIASYRDPQLIPTLKALVDNAMSPEALHVGICWQHGPEEGLEIFLDAGFDVIGSKIDFARPIDASPFFGSVIEIEYGTAKLSVIDVSYMDSQGACWARNAIQQLYAGEKYTLQLDSHHRFVPHWDKLCIDMLESLRSKSAKPLLTAYLPSFDPENDPAARNTQPWKMDFDRFIPEGAVFFLPATMEDHAARSVPMRARFYSAHFAFADGAFAVEVQHDPEYFFHGEEISIAARAFTHGYDLYHPHIVVSWHEYTRKNRVKIWDDHTGEARAKKVVKKDWSQRNDSCHLRNRILFGMDGLDPKSLDFGKYGFGIERTLRQYEEYAGLSFKLRGIQEVTKARLEPVIPAPTYASEAEWEATIIGSNDIHICVHRNEVAPELLKDYDFVCVSAEDDNGEIFRKDITGKEFMDYMKTDWLNYRMIFLDSRRPTKYIVWPHSASQGWCNRIEKQVK